MADDFSQIWVGEDKIGLRGLKEAVAEIARSHAESTDGEIRDALLERLSGKNYIASCARKEYGEALLRELKNSLANLMKTLPPKGYTLWYSVRDAPSAIAWSKP